MTPNFPVNGIACHYDDLTHDMNDQMLVKVSTWPALPNWFVHAAAYRRCLMNMTSCKLLQSGPLPVTSRVITPLTGVMTPVIHL